MTVDFGRITEALGEHGLAVMGAFHPRDDDDVPPCRDGTPAATLVLAGNVGRGMWRAFSRSRSAGPMAATDPLDRWSRARMVELADSLGATPLFITQGPPYPPIQRWAMRAGAYHRSPLGILIHPDHGLWHAFRGVLVFDQRLALASHDERPSPCVGCRDKPCLSGCPVGAFDGHSYRVKACTRHLDSDAGEDCLSHGCRARRACPVARHLIYGSDQARHHMTAFLNANRQS